MRRKDLRTKSLTAVIAASMVTSICPITAFAVSGSQVAANGTYMGDAHVIFNEVAEENEDEWEEYDVTVSMTVEDGKFADINVTHSDSFEAASLDYFNKAVNKKNGIQTLLQGQEATEETVNNWNIDAISNATCTSQAVKKAALTAIQNAPQKSEEETPADPKEEVHYGTMNVPYNDFYAAYNLTDSAVWEVESGIDAVSTATTSKFLGTTSLAKGTYNDGKYILGVAVPVKVSAEDFEKLDTNLTENANYYFQPLEEAPSVYSELSVGGDGSYSFSQFQEAAVQIDGAEVSEVELQGGYGDYQISLYGISPSGDVKVNGEDANITAYGAILYITGKNGETGTYGMTAMENLWFGTRVDNMEIAWSIKAGQGLKRAHGSGGEYYQFDTNGGTLNSVTLITNLGLIKLDAGQDLEEYYEGDLSNLTYSITNDSRELSISGIPEDLEDVKITVSGGLATDASVVDGKVTLSSEPVDGTNYTLTISSSNYPDITRSMSTPISEAQKARLAELIEKAEATTGYDSNADLQEHVEEAREMIESDTESSAEAATLIGELVEKIKKTYPEAAAAASLKGSNLVITLDGVALEGLSDPVYTLSYREGRKNVTLASGNLTSLDIALDTEPTVGTEYTLTIVSENYQDIVTTVIAEDASSNPNVNTGELEKTIAAAKALNEADYTPESWNALQTALTAAEAARQAEDQTDVDAAANTLQAAIDALVKVNNTPDNSTPDNNTPDNNTPDNNTPGNTTNNNTTNNNTTNNNTTNTAGTSAGAVRTGDPASILGLLGLAVSSAGVGGVTLRYKRKRRNEE